MSELGQNETMVYLVEFHLMDKLIMKQKIEVNAGTIRTKQLPVKTGFLAKIQSILVTRY